MTLYPVIMAGGSGTRFWPLSRRLRPKQFLPLASSKPLIVETADRLTGLVRREDIHVVCGKAHAVAVRRWLKGVPRANVLVEPAARNTAPAIGLAAIHIAQRDPRAVIAVLPSDHHIAAVDAFRRQLRAAAEVAADGLIVTLGIQPSRADTGYGYIRLGEPLGLSGGARKAEAFVEKPDAETARRYVASGEYLWNGGIFVFRADVMRDAMRALAPELSAGIERIRAALGKRTYSATLSREFPKLPAISIDYAVAEKAPNIAVVPGDFGWSDVGSFAAIAEVRPLDSDGNVVSGKRSFALDSRDCVVLGGNRVVAVVGMSGVVVVDAGDAVLVVPKERSQDVRKAVDALRAAKLERVL
ncbi:MAG TPA: mannose-1-phosphate guanylyltransferase [Myxococcaceae bacterium]|nr:mannose-1-phosphate guanylyltransferase [Myxococcaceae bacterium]